VELPATDPEGRIDIEALIAHARLAGNVVSLPIGASSGERASASLNSPPKAGRGARLALAASMLVAIAGAFTWLYTQRGTYSTDIGEQRSITLADGSTVDLNARTRIRVRMSEQDRRVELLEGQALFQVAKDKSRPFIVRSNDTQVRAVGTQFDVYRRKTGTTVTVLEGRVAVLRSALRSASRAVRERARLDEGASGESRIQQGARLPAAGASGTNLPANRDGGESNTVLPDGAGEALFLVAGEQVTVTGEHVPAPTRADVAAATAWTQRRLVFEASPLTQVAEEFNRYTQRRLIVEDPRLAEFHISGVYSSADPASLVLFLRAQPGIHIIETDTEIRISRK